ncbi:hypothetical protein CP533_1744 [Ophiocordyceps camponoti-saundersi (nom. inval.)]|nr:hypothetical protein CP533_1744 [Ophiocordyceps camponoti-saundersi (nom. inval.)]
MCFLYSLLATTLALLSLFPTTVSCGSGKLNARLCLTRAKFGRRLGPKQWHKPGQNCGQVIEPCIGTLSWCTHPGFYKKDGHDSEIDCFSARTRTTEWSYITTDCLQSFAACDGTDVVCSRVKDNVYRALCYESFARPSYLEPLSDGCLGAKREDDERCVGTKTFCEAPQRIKSYGSIQTCLNYRSGAIKQPAKAEFLLENPFRCFGDPTESCLGTEKFCGRLEGVQRHQCLASRERPPFNDEFSPECDLYGGHFSEACIGTEKWCADEQRISWYGSEEKCREFRKREASQKSPWINPNYECMKNPNGTEKCEGTERFCQWRAESSDICFSNRQLGPFLLADSQNNCSETKKLSTGEACGGTDSWCHDGFRRSNYRNEDECFRRRGFEQAEMARKVVEQFKPLLRDIILRYGKNMTLNAVYRDIVRDGGDEKSARKTVDADLRAYASELKRRVMGYAIGVYMNKVREKAR